MKVTVYLIFPNGATKEFKTFIDDSIEINCSSGNADLIYVKSNDGILFMGSKNSFCAVLDAKAK